MEQHALHLLCFEGFLLSFLYVMVFLDLYGDWELGE
jgi:hypothetical protein